jgi:hypothetical protein
LVKFVKFELDMEGGVCCALAGSLEFFDPGSGFLAVAICIRDLNDVSACRLFSKILK